MSRDSLKSWANAMLDPDTEVPRQQLHLSWKDVGLDPSIDPLLGPPKPWRCVDGWKSHTWMLELVESRPELTCDCRLCDDGMREALADEITVELSPAVAVRAELIIDHYGDDVSQWIEVEPA